ncbi:TIGR02678 family protein [Amycolatopsis sp. WAC 04197]|uniref:TIGR02678 family protein n=1 Tax=Amycolatopsis sp. WAC 04197 TaxID=2203199 RepID=UPI002107ABE2|nr:TIGR02678 family protein [Amycolatopsis sp. WAC 04197]
MSRGSREHEADDRRTAARELLMHPVLTAARHPDLLIQVRKHAPQLKRMFAATLGYQLVVEPTFARLLKAPLTVDAPVRPARTRTDRPFTPRAYRYLALVCASLLASTTADQLLMSALAEQVRADAVTAGVTVGDSTTESREFVSAIYLLVDWGVLTETDGSVAGWETRQEEALLDVHRPLLPHLLSRSMTDIGGAVELEQPRRGLRRKLVENPLVRREELTEGERDALSRERRELTRMLEESFGLTVEARAEGVLAYDVEEKLSDVVFPGTGTVAHVGLLLVNALADDLEAKAADTVLLQGRIVPGVFVPWAVVDSNIDLLIEQYGKAFGKAYTQDPAMLRREVALLLESLSLVVITEEGLVLHPASARYRPEPHRAPARTRAMRRLDDGDTTGQEEKS